MNVRTTHDSSQHSVLAAAVGLGDITLDRTVATGSRAIRAGGDARCDLPFPSDTPIQAWRDDDSWHVRVPAGARVSGADVTDGEVTLYDWSGAITLSAGDAWLKLWPTRSERFTDQAFVRRNLGFLGRALPLCWGALLITLGVASLGLWASTALNGNLSVFALGLDGSGEYMPDRVASFGDGDLAMAGMAMNIWAAEPDEIPVEEDAVAEEAEDVEPEESRRETMQQERGDAVAEASSDAAARKRSARRSGGAGSFGFGGGTDDGFADRSQSIRALEKVLASCLDGDQTHRVKLAVDMDGRVMPRSMDWRGSWDSDEQDCVSQAIEQWAFPGGEDEYEVSLRVRKNTRRSRA